ncbi:MAG: NAD(P)-dependent oxidoreductase [Actinobacteria bacterium]|nr:NAD(P)-dependent oxidoreductase [Microbacteriaceae bacterium]NBS62030.1 NAD(P)-dependent oxidoreductase [Microbacteriaceae bacterium]NBT20944.1 NAD(P)-dependent oxidoreductase [Actinomycetota bacterium]
MKKFLVTGAAGFLGRHVVTALAGSDVQVAAVVRSGSEDRAKVLPGVVHVISSPDIFAEDASWWKQQCADIDAVLHLAWYTKSIDYLVSEQNQHCAAGTLQLADGAIKAGVRRFVGIGTCLEYEQTGERLTTSTRLRPVGEYAESKAATFFRLGRLFDQHSVSFSWCRLFYLYGEGEHESRLVPYLHRQLREGREVRLSNPEQVLDFMDVKDVAERLASIALSERNGAFNVCSGHGTTVRELSLQVAREYGRESLIVDADSKPESPKPAIVGQPSPYYA